MVTLRLKDLIDGMGITRYELAKRTGIRFHIIDNYYKNKVKWEESAMLPISTPNTPNLSKSLKNTIL